MTNQESWPVWKGLETAVRLAQKGLDEDRKGNYEKAVMYYEESEGYFLHSIKHEVTIEEGKEVVRNKCNKYVERAKQLRTHLEKIYVKQ